jgi:hypothetical protein
MPHNPQIAVLNSTIRASSDSVNLTRLLLSHYGHLGYAEKDQFTMALIMELGTREAIARTASINADLLDKGDP